MIYLIRAKWDEKQYDNEGFERDGKEHHDQIRIVEADSIERACEKFCRAIGVKGFHGFDSYGGGPFADLEVSEVIK